MLDSKRREFITLLGGAAQESRILQPVSPLPPPLSKLPMSSDKKENGRFVAEIFENFTPSRPSATDK